ncbi:MAG: hypothetical protein FK732_02405 [Asgard group archaeon]|nr:hypothetical protein [Asgard group archaeon]
MEATISLDTSKPVRRSRRFATLDFARGAAIFLMIGLHTLSLVLNINEMLDAGLEQRALINLVMLMLLPFYGGLAGFFLLVSSASNMVSMYRDLDKGSSVRSIVFKQIFGGVLLLIFAMLCESLIGYHGAFGEFFKYLDDPSIFFQYDPLLNYEHWLSPTPIYYNWQVLLYRFNHFETIHTIAWCIILNGLVQGALSLKEGWKDRRRMIIAYVVLAVVVVALTQPIWDIISLYGPDAAGYPFGFTEAGNRMFTPVLGEDKWWRFIAAPFLSALAAPMEPIFPYLAISFIGSIIGIVITRPKEEINKKFPRNMFLVGAIMFVSGLIGVAVVILGVMNTQGFGRAIDIYVLLPYHRNYSPDFQNYIPPFSWLAQFLLVNGFALMLVMLLFRLIEFRGRSKAFSDKTKVVRRFGTVAFSNYNNQAIYYVIFFFLSWIIKPAPYDKFFWPGTVLTVAVALGVYTLLLYGWEKIKYTGSIEWIIRTINNNLIPLRRQRFDPSVKWWQKGQVDVEGAFYNPEWIDLVDPDEEKEKNKEEFLEEKYESRLALRLSLIGLFTILLNAASIFGLFASLRARKLEGKNKKNTRALIISIVGCVLFAAFYIVCFSLKISALGISF